jgi:hypothetical protein
MEAVLHKLYQHGPMKDIICILIGIVVFALIGKGAYNSAKEKDMMQPRFYAILACCIGMVIMLIFVLIRMIYRSI